ncbi:valine--tRNA ligase-like [Antedon mediterranea]|uniref:valine--tRNA ligase-like n=1 Tax=Antedon mediterranea TaxID=105859 RepID=UPI003AF73F84
MEEENHPLHSDLLRCHIGRSGRLRPVLARTGRYSNSFLPAGIKKINDDFKRCCNSDATNPTNKSQARVQKLRRIQDRLDKIISCQETVNSSVLPKWNENEVIRYEIPYKPGDKKDTSQPLPQRYSPSYVEAAWYEWWQEMGFFKPKQKSEHKSEPFVMCLPPPNVNGNLHLGHALTVAIEDSIVRWNRMCGRETLWLPGCDHGGIATQVVVENQLLSNTGQTRHDLGREKFINEVWKWKEQKGDEIYKQLKRLGASLDWTRERFTMDKIHSRAVTEAFVRLHDDGTIYRSNSLVNWSCALKSAISDIEVDQVPINGRSLLSVPGYEDKVLFGCLEEFAYPLENSGEIVVATTRIETMLGGTAIAVNPYDPRHVHHIGGAVIHPFTGERLPIIGDVSVNKDFGTGAVMIAPGHDYNDYEIGQKHNLPTITVINEDGNMADTTAQFQGMKRFHARVAVLEALKERNLYRGSKDNPMVVPVCSHSKDIIEPLIKPQWFVNCTEMAVAAVEAVEDGDLEIIPDMRIKRWNRWLKKSRDWCLSQQLWWGHRIPAYFVTIDDDAFPEGKDIDSKYWVSAHTEETARKKAAKRFGVLANNIKLRQDDDVLDTWFSSGIIPFAIHGWPDETPDLSQYYPSTVLETGYDILLLWVARMVMLGQRLTGELPFKQVYLHSLVKDFHGRKMSKSLGNVIDPIDVIEGVSLDAMQDRLKNSNWKHDNQELKAALKGQRANFPNGIPECGADGLRFALCTYHIQGVGLNLNVRKLVKYRHFYNKIYNAVKFGYTYFGSDFKLMIKEDVMQNSRAIDRWILSKLSHTAEICNSGFHDYKLRVVTSAIRHFWHKCLCDVYLETIKPSLYNDESGSGNVSRSVLFMCIEAGLRLLSPFMPYLTEELYQRLPGLQHVPSICVAQYPTTEEFPYKDAILENNTDLMLDVARGIRSLKNQYEVTQVNAFVVCSTNDVYSILCSYQDDIKTLTKAASVELLSNGITPTGCAVSTISPSCTVAVQLEGVVDVSKLLSKFKLQETKRKSQTSKLKKNKNNNRYTKLQGVVDVSLWNRVSHKH